LAAGVLGNLNGAHGITGWRWLFIIEGVITIGIAAIAAFFLPNFPATSKFLTEEERHFAEWRLADDANESDDADAVSLLGGLKMALRDWRLYVFIIFQHLSLLSQTFQYFFPSIVNTLGYGQIETLLLTAPVWFATFLVSLFVTWTSGKTGDRSIHIICLMLVSAIGNAIVVSTTKTGPRFFAMFLMPMGAVSAYQILITWVANSFPRPMVKRSASIAICNMIGNAANIYGSFMYPASDGPRFIPGGSANACICLAVALMALVIRYIHIKENKKLEKLENEGVGAVPVANRIDVRATGFRYVI
jgi:predicted MFS family arabinose efflux permease